MSRHLNPSTHNEPEEPLGLTVHALPDPTMHDPQRTRMGRLKLLLLLLMCASPVIASYLTYFFIRPEGRTNYATLITPVPGATREWPDVPMKDLQGQPVSARELHGQWILVAVGPSSCDSACEERLFMQRQLREMTGRERTRLDKVWLVTDEGPVRPELARALLATPAMRVLRADRRAVAEWLQPEAGADLDQHLYVVDPMGQWMMRAPVQTDPARFKKDLERLLKASQFWDPAGRGDGR